MKSKKYLILKIKYIFLRDSYVCPRWIFIFHGDQAQINSVKGRFLEPYYQNLLENQRGNTGKKLRTIFHTYYKNLLEIKNKVSRPKVKDIFSFL